MKDENPSASDRDATLSNLLKIKRLERPESAFWEQFEHELRLRQRAASLPRRRWWHRYSRPQRWLVSTGSAVAAAAALVLALVPAERPAAPVTVVARRAPVVLPAGQPQPASPAPVAALPEPEPIVESDFVLDVVQRPEAAAGSRFVTVSAPETLRTSAAEQYTVYTLLADGAPNVF